jgi:ABC-type transport system involved in multi-copper enzyme maturation permease subunit
MALTIAWRELAERRFFFATAAILALLPFAAALLPDANRLGYADFVAVTAGALAIGIPLAMALILGVTTIGRELAERRMSFYFSKPIGAVSLWIGKLLAALITIASSYAIIIIPTMLVFRDRWSRNWGFDAFLMAAIVIGGSFVLFLIGHCLSTMLRSRSAWVGLDIALLALTLAGAWLVARPLVVVWAMKALTRIGMVFGALTVLVLLISGGYQLVHGRTDLHRNHAALSRFIWIAMAIVLAICGGVVAWIVTPEPDDLVELSADQPPSGRWAALGGRARGRMDYVPAFLIDAESGAYRRVGAVAPFVDDATFSGDGRWLVLPEAAGFSRTQFELMLHDVESGAKRATGILAPPFSSLVLSDDGSRVAVFDRSLLTVHDLERGKLLASMRIAEGTVRTRATFFFRDNDTLRIYRNDGDDVKIFECRIAARQLVQVGTIRTADGIDLLSVNGDGSRLLMRHYPPPSSRIAPYAVVLDGSGNALFEAKGSEGAMRFRAMRLLEDGRLAIIEQIRGEARLRVLDARGSQLFETSLGKATGSFLTHELTGGKVIAVTAREWALNESHERGWSSMIVDVNSGAIERRAAMRPVTLYEFGSDPRQLRHDGPLLFVDAQGSLVRWSPASGEQKVLVKIR